MPECNDNRPNEFGSKLVKRLENAWQQLRKIEPDIPKAVIVLMPAWEHTLGAFSNSTWQFAKKQKVHEIAINPRLCDFPEKLLATMLHEAAHAIIYDKDGDKSAGCSGKAGKYYHNDKFRRECFRLGLACERRNKRYGFTQTYWPEDRTFPPRYKAILQYLSNNVEFGFRSSEGINTKRLAQNDFVIMESVKDENIES